MPAAAAVGVRYELRMAPATISSRTDSGRHGASPAQVRGKTEPPHRPLSFPPNSKPSRAINHR